MDQHRLDRIRLLSARFHELQGLRVSLAGGCMTLGVGGYLIVTPQPTGTGAMIAILLSFVPVIPGMRWLNRYYSTTFGRQTQSPARSVPRFLFLYFAVAWPLNTWIPSIPPGAPAAATVALISLWVAVRDWPWRAHYLGSTAAVVVGFAASASGAAPLDPDLTLGWIYFLMGASMVPIGLLDHLLLVRLIREVRGPLAADAPNRANGAGE